MIKKILKAIGFIALILVFVLTVMVVVGSIFRDEMLLSPWGTGFFIIASGSMEPNIPVGSIIFVHSVPQDRISVGDAITYFASDMTTVVTHRVVDIYKDRAIYYFTTRGDANNTDDQPVVYNRVIGRVVFTIPGSSFFVKLLGNAFYVGLSVIALGLVLCFAGILSGARKKKRVAEKKIAKENSADTEENIFDESSWDVDYDTDQLDLDLLLKDVDFDEIDFNEEDKK